MSKSAADPLCGQVGRRSLPLTFGWRANQMDKGGSVIAARPVTGVETKSGGGSPDVAFGAVA
jgi:hypothetical protein